MNCSRKSFDIGLITCLLIILTAFAARAQVGRSTEDRAKINQARADLAIIKTGLTTFQAESDYSAYPTTASINSYEDIVGILSPYMSLPGPEEASWTFVSYVSVRRDTFVLRARARDSMRTLIDLTPTEIRTLQDLTDQVIIRQAKEELEKIRIALCMYQAENDSSAFPPTSVVTRTRDLMNLVNPYVRMPEEIHWSYVSYVSAAPDTFVLLTKARDSRFTVLAVNPTGVIEW